MTSLFQRLLLPKLHMHGTLVLGAGFFALLSLQRRLDAAAMGLVPAALVVAGNWLLGSWMLFLLVKSNLLVPMLVSWPQLQEELFSASDLVFTVGWLSFCQLLVVRKCEE